MTRTYARDELDFPEDGSVQVVSAALKFVIFVPPLEDGGEPLVYPAGHRKAGAPIVDWEGNPIGKRGIVFFNSKDNSVQAVPGDGTGVVIINQVTEEQAAAISGRQGGVKDILAYALETFGLNDVYNSDIGYVRSKLRPVGHEGGSGPLRPRRL